MWTMATASDFETLCKTLESLKFSVRSTKKALETSLNNLKEAWEQVNANITNKCLPLNLFYTL